jgi:hypothetical protein
MSIVRRVLRGTPLLVSAAGAVVTIACTKNGGGGHPVGNLMAPPDVERIEVCVTVVPEDATVTLSGLTPDERGCAQVPSDGPVMVDISAEGYETVHEEVPAQAGQTYPYELAPTEGDDTEM